MSIPRMNLIAFILGMRGSGKTYYTINEIIKKHKKKVLIVDTVDHPAYRAEGYQLIDVEMLKRWKGGTKRIVTNLARIGADVEIMDKYLNNCLIVFEDATKYLRSNTPMKVFSFIYDSKQKNIDIVFQYHGFKKILPELLDNANFITLFKLEEHLVNYEHKIPSYERVVEAYNQVKASKNPYAKKTIEVN